MRGTKKPEVVDDEGAGLIGYARVSTAEQNLDMQIAALKKAGCINIYDETVSAASSKRHKLNLALKELRRGDTFVVWRLDRLARSIRDLFKKLEQIEEAGAKFRSLTENFDTTTAGGRLLLHVIAAMAEFERDLTIERTQAGLRRARERGEVLGAKPKISTKKFNAIVADLKKRDLSVKDVAKKHGVATSTIYHLIPGGRTKAQREKVRDTRKALKAALNSVSSLWSRNGAANH
jgi:DNA invertase Pin-like site-specific DNA recombinase